MKKMRIAIMLIVMAVCLNGCATSGRFSAIDIDLRSPEQIIAYQVEAKVPYDLNEVAVPNVNNAATSKVSPVWQFLAPIIEAFKGRLRILSFEWKNK